MPKTMLPIGSVVLLKHGDKRLMITGRYTGVEGGSVNDYSGVPYPEGINGSHVIFFQESAIENVFALGFQDAEEEAYKAKVLRDGEELFNEEAIDPIKRSLGGLAPSPEQVFIILKFVVNTLNPDGVSLDTTDTEVAGIKNHFLPVSESAKSRVGAEGCGFGMVSQLFLRFRQGVAEIPGCVRVLELIKNIPDVPTEVILGTISRFNDVQGHTPPSPHRTLLLQACACLPSPAAGRWPSPQESVHE